MEQLQAKRIVDLMHGPLIYRSDRLVLHRERNRWYDYLSELHLVVSGSLVCSNIKPAAAGQAARVGVLRCQPRTSNTHTPQFSCPLELRFCRKNIESEPENQSENHAIFVINQHHSRLESLAFSDTRCAHN